MYDDQEKKPGGTVTTDHAGDRNQRRDPPDNGAEGTYNSARAHSEVFWVREPSGETLIYIDPAAENIWGIDTRTLLSNPEVLIQSVHPDDRESFRHLFDGRHGGEYDSLEYRIVLPDSTIGWMRARGFSVRSKDNRVLYTFGATTDITEEISTATARENEIEQRTSFLSVASHELRTPLQPILGYLYLMLDNPDQFGLNEEGVQFLNAVQGCTNRMVDIINRILVASFANAGRELLQPCREAVSLEKLVTDVVLACNAGNGMTYSIEIPPGQVLETDWKYLYEALYEICANVMKHSDPPRHVTFRYDENSKAHIISVSDNGPGMDEKTLKNLFQPFYIGDRKNLSRTCGRLGLGLTIAKRDVEILGGTISADSTPHQGSTLTIRLPRRYP